jgi:hypothetical protein
MNMVVGWVKRLSESADFAAVEQDSGVDAIL